MKRFFIFIFCWQLSFAESITVSDDLGRNIVLEKTPQSIISLAPDITELLFEIGAGEQVIAVSAHSDYPKAAQQLPVVADYQALDMEKVLTIVNGKPPELIVVNYDTNLVKQLDRLEQLKVVIYYIKINSIDDIASTMEKLGVLTEHSEKATIAAAVFRKTLQTLIKNYATNDKIKIFYQLNSQPFITINGDNVINEVIELCGGENIFADSKIAFPQVNIEAIIERNPQIILFPDDLSSTTRDSWISYWQQWTKIDAVANKQIMSVPSDLLNRFGPRLLLGAESVCEQLNRIDYYE